MLRPTTPFSRMAVPAAAALAVGLTLPALQASADPAAVEKCVQDGKVWVHVAYDETVSGACAAQFATAQAAIDDTGLSKDQGWLKVVDGREAKDKEWWSVYTLHPTADGTYPAAWDFAQVGVGELKLAESDVLGLQLQDDYDTDAVAPAVNPVANVEVKPGMPKAGF